MPINENELTKEMVAKAMKCETAEDLIALAKAEGIDLTKEEAEAYMAELADVELDEPTWRNWLTSNWMRRSCRRLPVANAGISITG